MISFLLEFCNNVNVNKRISYSQWRNQKRQAGLSSPVAKSLEILTQKCKHLNLFKT